MMTTHLLDVDGILDAHGPGEVLAFFFRHKEWHILFALTFFAFVAFALTFASFQNLGGKRLMSYAEW